MEEIFRSLDKDNKGIIETILFEKFFDKAKLPLN